jgi:regulator of sigma E protease
MSVILFIVGILLFISLVVVHELGHFIVARRNGVVAEEFGIFFPPRLWSRKMKGGWVFSINLLPLGGFVKLKGEHDTDTEPGSFGAATLWAKSKIMAAGVIMNLITAFVILLALAWLGMPKLVDNQFTVKSDTTYLQRAVVTVSVGSVENNSPAAKAGLKPHDQIIAIGQATQGADSAKPSNLTKLESSAALPNITKKYQGQKVDVEYKRNGTTKYTIVQLHSTAEVNAASAAGKPIGYLGIGIGETRDGVTLTRSTWSAPVVAAGLMAQYTQLTFQGLGKAVAGLGGIFAGAFTHNKVASQSAQTEASSQVSGPVGIYFVLKDGSALGYRFMLLIIAIISLTLAIMNILPIPALDGGRLWITLVARALKKPLSAHTEEVVNATGFAILLLLIVVISIVDVRRFF